MEQFSDSVVYEGYEYPAANTLSIELRTELESKLLNMVTTKNPPPRQVTRARINCNSYAQKIFKMRPPTTSNQQRLITS
jgi:hypothetical protein